MDREEHFLLGRVAAQAKRFHEMADHMCSIATCSKTKEMSPEERNMLSLAFSRLITNKRKQLRFLGKQETQETSKGRMQELQWCLKLKKEVEEEYKAICERVLNLLDEELIPTATTSDAMVSFLKMKADYHRYTAEFQTESKRRQSAESSLIAYKRAQEVAERTLRPTNPMRLSLALNLSVFYYDILNCAHFALEVAQEALDDAATDMDKCSTDTYKDTDTIVQLLKDNLERWTKNTSEGK